MRWQWLGIVLVCAIVSQVRGAEESFPFRARVVVDEAEVRCGPSEQLYATDRLARDSEVEVYRRDPGGWFAIRPTARSFSWIPGAKLWKSNNDPMVASVIADDAVAWVGSLVVGVQEHRWQVKLNRGETVAILSEEKFPAADPSVTNGEIWCRIAPPSGEFRWIRERDVARAAPPGLAIDRPLPPRDSAIGSERTTTDRAGTIAPASFIEAAGSERGAVRPAADQTPVNGSPVFRTPRGRETIARANPPSETRNLEQHLAVSPPADSTPLSDELLEIETQLSLMVTRDPVVWNLDTLHDRAEVLVNSGKTAVERGRARLVLDKIEHFEGLQRRFIQVERKVAIAKGEAAAAASLEPRFDGSGWLYPVRSEKKQVPAFVLMDEKQHILCYVNPSPGLNLRRYVNKKVGIYGQRTNAKGLNAQVLTASQVVDLERFQR